MRKRIQWTAVLGVLMLCACSPARTFKQRAERENAACPLRLNETTVLDSVVYHQTDNVQLYYYSVSGELDNATYLQAHYAECQQVLQAGLDGTPEMKAYWDFGTTVKYIYCSATTHDRLAEFSFTGPANSTR